MTTPTRREVLKLSGGAFIALTALPYTNILGSKNMQLDWEKFITLLQEISTTQSNLDWDQGAYTEAVSKIVERLQLDDAHITKLTDQYENISPDFPEIRNLHKEELFEISLIEFAPGEGIPLHDHPDMTGVVLCMEGNVKVTHYDKLDVLTKDGRPLLKFHNHLNMKSGDIAMLTENQGNIHTLKAKEFTRMIDIFTPPYNIDRRDRARYYWLDDEEYQEQEGVFGADTSITFDRRDK